MWPAGHTQIAVQNLKLFSFFRGTSQHYGFKETQYIQNQFTLLTLTGVSNHAVSSGSRLDTV